MHITNPDYVELGYIRADWQQYIDLPAVNINDSTFYFEFNVKPNLKRDYLSFFSTNNTRYEAWIDRNERGTFRYNNVKSYDFAAPVDAVHLYAFERNSDGENKVYYDNQIGQLEEIRNFTTAICNSDNYLRLFNNGGSNSYFSGDIYHVKIELNDLPIYDLYPAKRLSDNEAGLYDIYSDTFFPSNSAVEFLAGPEKEAITVTVNVTGTGTVSVPLETNSFEYIEVEATPGVDHVFAGYRNTSNELVTLDRKFIFFSGEDDVEFEAKFADASDPVTTLTRTFTLYHSTGNTKTRQADDISFGNISVKFPKVLKSFADKQGALYGNQSTNIYGYYVTNIASNLVFDDYVEDYTNLYSLTNMDSIRNFFAAGDDLITDTGDHGYNIRLVDEVSGYYVTITLCNVSDWGQGHFYDKDNNLIYNCRSLFARDKSASPVTYTSLAFTGFEDGSVTENSSIVLVRAGNTGVQKSVLIQSDQEGNLEGSEDLLNWFIGVKRGEIVEPSDPYDNLGNSSQGGGNGAFEFVFDFTPVEELPERISALSSGFVSLYQIPDTATMNDISEFMLLPNWKQRLSQFFSEPSEAIISLHILPVELSGTEVVRSSVIAGGVPFEHTDATAIEADKVVNQYYIYDLGFIDVPEIWGSALDYQPFTQAEIYLPYIGYENIDVDTIQGKTLGLVYAIDLLSGDCVAFISVNDDLKYQFSGNCAARIPYTANSHNFIQEAGAMFGGLGSMALGVATANPVMIAAGGMGAIGGGLSYVKNNYKHGGSIGETHGFLSLQKPVLYLVRPNQNVPEQYNHFKGLPSNITATLSTLKGFTQVDTIHLEDMNATESEKTEISLLLKEGVLI